MIIADRVAVIGKVVRARRTIAVVTGISGASIDKPISCNGCTIGILGADLKTARVVLGLKSRKI
jgi:hypothetical protein